MESRIKIILTIGLICMISHSMSAKETSWIGSNDKWEDPDNWSNGVPQGGDTAYIHANVQVEILEGVQAEARFVEMSNGASLIVRDEGQLIINGEGDGGIDLYGNSTSFTVEGYVHLFDCGTSCLSAYNASDINITGFLLIEDCSIGIYVQGGNLINDGVLQILNTSNSGLSLSLFASFENHGAVRIDSASFGVSFISGSSGLNSNSIDISNCTMGGISVRHNALFSNDGQVSIDHAVRGGVVSYGTVKNNGIIEMDSIGNSFDVGKAIHVDSFACCDTFYLGLVVNTGSILIGISQGDGVYLESSTSFQNSGILQMTQCTRRGIVLNAGSNLLQENSGEITQVINGEEGLLIEEEAILQVDPGGLLNIN